MVGTWQCNVGGELKAVHTLQAWKNVQAGVMAKRAGRRYGGRALLPPAAQQLPPLRCVLHVQLAGPTRLHPALHSSRPQGLHTTQARALVRQRCQSRTLRSLTTASGCRRWCFLRRCPACRLQKMMGRLSVSRMRDPHQEKCKASKIAAYALQWHGMCPCPHLCTP